MTTQTGAGTSTTEKVITKEEVEEMRMRVQRRQQGNKSNDFSYLTKLDPTVMLSENSQDYSQNQHYT